MKANSQSSLQAAAQILSGSQMGGDGRNLQYTLGTSAGFDGNTPTSSALSYIIPRGQNQDLSTHYKKARQHRESSNSNNNNSTFGAHAKKLPLQSAQSKKSGPKLALSPLEQISSKVDALESRVYQAEKKVTNLREVCRLQQDFCDNWEIEQVSIKQKLDKIGGKEMSQSSSTEGLNKRMKDLKSRKEANPGGDQIYKVLKDKLTEFDSQLTNQMEEMEKRLKKHVEVATRAQKSSIEQVQTQIDKLGEELAFDVNRIEKEAKKAVYQVGLIKKDRSFTEQLLDQQSGVGIQVLQPLRELENRVNNFEFHKANCLELQQLEQKFAQSRSEMAVIKKLQKGNSKAIEKIAQNIYKRAAEPKKQEPTNIVNISGGKLVSRPFRSKNRKPVYKVHNCMSPSPDKVTLNRGRKAGRLYNSVGRSGSRSRSSKHSKSSASITRQKPTIIEVSEVQQHRKNKDQKFASMLSETDEEDMIQGSRSSNNHQRRHKQSNGILRNEIPAEIAAPIIVSGTNSSKQVSFANKKRRSNKKENSRPKMMNLDPSTHFANELDEFERLEEQVNKDEEVLVFTDQESENVDLGVGDEMLDGLQDLQSEPISNQKLQRANQMLDAADLEEIDVNNLSMSNGSNQPEQQEVELQMDSSHEVFPSRDKHVKPGKKLKLMLKA